MMTTETRTMLDVCGYEFRTMLTRVEAVIVAQYPDTLRQPGVWSWLDEHDPDSRGRLRQITVSLNSAWLNGLIKEMKELTLEWGRLQLKIYKGYDLFLKGR